MTTLKDSFSTTKQLSVGSRTFSFRSLKALTAAGLDVSRLPVTIKIVLENLLRHEDDRFVDSAAIRAVAGWKPKPAEREIFFMPARVLMQDFTGVPAIVDLAAMRDAIKALGGDPAKINPLVPVDLVVDHSVQVDKFGTPDAFATNSKIEFDRNRERYAFLKWGQKAFSDFRVVPPETGIVHQVNLEYLAPVVFTRKSGETVWAFPDTVVGTDSHTTMINGLGVLGWGVGGIEAEAAMLGQPMPLLIPQVVGVRLKGKLSEGVTATDAVLTITELLRKRGVVGKFVEFFGPGLSQLSLADRATIANMCPEYGATVGFFPVDAQTLEYLRMTGRSEEQVALVEAYFREQGMFREDGDKEAQYSEVAELDLAGVEACLAGPRRPQDRVNLKDSKGAWGKALESFLSTGKGGAPGTKAAVKDSHGHAYELEHGSVVIAAITSCTNTSNPAVLIAAGLVAKKAAEKGLTTKPWVKTSLAPGSKVVIDYLTETGLLPFLEKQRFHLVGYGCTTCIGNSGPLPEAVSEAIAKHSLVAAAVLSGNRNFEGRVHPQVRAAYLASPPLVVAYALAGRMDIDLAAEPIGTGTDGQPVFLKDIWPADAEIQEAMKAHVHGEMFRKQYANAFEGDANWKGLSVTGEQLFAWEPGSTYVRKPPYFDGMAKEPAALKDIAGARVLAVLGDSVTTDHISPAGSIAKDGPAGRCLIEQAVAPKDFNSYGARRGNHEIMVRGTFANIRLRNLLAPGTEGGVTKRLPEGKVTSIYEASETYIAERVPLIVLAGKEYGSGSSRDWAAKGPALLGIKAVIAESYERIHRSNLIGMGVLPMQFRPGESAKTLALSGDETFDIAGIATELKPGKEVVVKARSADGKVKEFRAVCRLDTPVEVDYYRHGGILLYVLRQLLKA